MRASPALLMGIGLVLAGAAYYFAYYGPTAVKTAALLAEANRLEGQVQALTRARQALPEAQEALRALRERHAKALERTMRVQDLPRGAGFVSRAAASAGIRALSVTYTLQGAAGADMGTVRFDVQVEGPYAGLVRLVETIERAFDRVEFGSLTVSAGPETRLSPAGGWPAAGAATQVAATAPTSGLPAGEVPPDRLSQVAGLFSYLQMLALLQSGAMSGLPAQQIGAAGTGTPASATGSAGAATSGGAGGTPPEGAVSIGSAVVGATLSFTVPVRLAEDATAEAVAWKAPPLPSPEQPQAAFAPNPFEPASKSAVEARVRPVPDPEAMALRVTGIARSSGGLVAVLSVRDRSHLVREGTRLGALQVLAVRPDGVDVQVDRQRVFVPLRVAP